MMFGKKKVAKKGGLTFESQAPEARNNTGKGGDDLRAPAKPMPETINRHKTGDTAKGSEKVIRILGFCLVLSLATNVFQAGAFGTLLPLRRDVPQVIVVDRAGDVLTGQAIWRTGNSQEQVVNETETTQFIERYFRIVPDFNLMGKTWQTACVDTLPVADNFKDRDCAYLPARMNGQDHERYVRENLAEVQQMVKAGEGRTVSLMREPQLLDVYEEYGENVYNWKYQLRLEDWVNGGKARPEPKPNPNQATAREEPYLSQAVEVLIWTTFNGRYRKGWQTRYLNPLNWHMRKISVAQITERGGE